VNVWKTNKQNMKTLLKTVLIACGAALTASVAQAVPNLSDVLTSPSGTPSTFTVVSSVSAGSGIYTGDYQYTYTISASAPLANNFTVEDVYAAPISGSILVDGVTTTGGFTGGYNPVVDNVNWSQSGSGVASLDSLSFTFDSPLPPTIGSAVADDGSSWNDNGSTGVYVPNTPDGGMTMTLLGGAFLGLSALRRKLGC
jgi:hypothetical protein